MACVRISTHRANDNVPLDGPERRQSLMRNLRQRMQRCNEGRLQILMATSRAYEGRVLVSIRSAQTDTVLGESGSGEASGDKGQTAHK